MDSVIEQIPGIIERLLDRPIAFDPTARICGTCGDVVSHPLIWCRRACPGKYSSPFKWKSRLRHLASDDRDSVYGWLLFADEVHAALDVPEDCKPEITTLAIRIAQRQLGR